MSCPGSLLSAFLLFFSLSVNLVQSQYSFFPPNPCPHILEYTYDSMGRVLGLVTIPYDGNPVLEMQVNATVAGHFGGNERMKILVLSHPEEILHRNILNVKYQISFPDDIPVVPRITSIVLNYIEYCSGPADTVYPGGPPITKLNARHKLFFQSGNRAAIETDDDSKDKYPWDDDYNE